jgi:7-cyano-7-deazaguanine synthase
MMSEAIILLSGGMDSGVLLAWARRRYDGIHALSFDYGSRHGVREREKARDLAEHFDVPLKNIPLSFFNELFTSSLLTSGDEVPEGPYAQDNISSTVVPFRNGIMLSIAVGYAEDRDISTVLIASHGGDHPIYPDCRPAFTEAMSRAAQEGTFGRVSIQAPFALLDKKAIAGLGRELGLDFRMTYSCYKGGRIHCGRCATCLERKAALGHDQGLDPTEYER